MRKIFNFLLLLSAFSCNQPLQAPDKKEVAASKKSKFTNLLSKFKEKAVDTLHVYSPEDLMAEYEGIALDSADAVLFPEDIAQQHFYEPPGLFAVYQFPIDRTRTGLIVRTPSEYAPTSLKLFFLDKEKDAITSYLELAENWGDAGDYMSKEAWLFHDSAKGHKALISLLEGYDNSIDDENDTTKQESNYYYLIDLAAPRADTISKDEKELVKTFGNLLGRKANP